MLKAKIVNQISSTKTLINDESFKSNSEMKHMVRKTITTILEDIKQIEQLNVQATQQQGAWISFKGKIDPEILNQRKRDVVKLKEHHRQLQELSIGKKPEGMKFNREIKSKGLDDLNYDQCEDIPDVDISDGLKQIEEQKQKFEENLKKISKQVDEMKNAANDMSAELDKQTKLLDNIDNDVTKYNAKLSKLNERMDKALEQVGGSTRMIFLVFGMIICLVLMVVVYIVFEVYLRPLLDQYI